MVMTNNLKKITAFFLLATFLGLPTYAQAQNAAPGSKPATAQEQLQRAQ